MNKSKLLKKSLAMILAVMMIVAMIPLGASAATNNSAVTDLQAIYIGADGGHLSAVNVGSDKTFTADITKNATDWTIWVSDLYTGEKANLVDKNKANVDVATQPGTSATNVDLANDFTKLYDDNGNGYYKITLKLDSQDNSAHATYTVVLKEVNLRTSTQLDASSVKATKALGVNVTNNVINVTAPLGYGTTTGGYTQNSGNLTFNTKDGATATVAGKVSGSTATGYTLTGYADGDTITVVSESTGNTGVYTVRVTEEPILTSFKAGDKAAAIDHKKLTIKATYPASVLEIPNDQDHSPAYSMTTNFTAAQATEVAYDGTGAFVALRDGKKACFADESGTPVFLTGKKIQVTCKDVITQYALTFNTELASEKTITAATVDNETATLSGSTFNVNLQSSAADADTVKVALAIPKTATATAAKGTIAFADDATISLSDDKNVKTVSNATVTVGALKAGLIVVVTAQDQTTKQYTIKATTTGVVDYPRITSFTLKDGSTVVATSGAIAADADTITLTVPYMTTDADLAGYTLAYTTNSYTKVQKADGTDLTSGVSTGTYAGLTTLSASGDVFAASVGIQAVSKNTTATTNKYTLKVVTEKPAVGKTMGSIVLTTADQYRKIDTTNQWTARPDADKNVKMQVAYSATTAATDLFLKSVDVAKGGVLFVDTTNATSTTDTINGLTLAADPLNSAVPKTTGTKFTTTTIGGTTKVTLWVVPEEQARLFLNAAGPINTTYTVLTNAGATPYVLTVAGKEANHNSVLNNLKVGDTNLTVKQATGDARAYTISGTIPYGLTCDPTATDDAAHANYITFTQSTYATVADNTGVGFISGGDKDGDGDPDAAPAADNGMLRFERNDSNGTVNVFVKGAAAKADTTALVVTAEDGVNKTTYTFDTANLKYAAPNNEALFTSFNLAGSNGSITRETDYNYTISVTVPYGTKLNALTPVFTTSAGAKVYLSDGTTQVKSGNAILDFSSNVVLKVKSESEGRVVTFTVKTTVADEFSDVPKGAWYHDYVMQAAAANIVNGKGNGIFDPNGNVTRKEFAVMTVRMLGIDPTTLSYTTSSYTDVAKDTFGGMEAIEYLTANDIIGGDGNGKFRPGSPITRQEAAKVVKLAKGLTGTPTTAFKDASKIASWATEYVNACAANEIFSGDNNGNFNPTKYITRAETAKVMILARNK